MSESLVGTRVREYEIVEELGRSDASVVYRARHVLLDEDRALKVVSGSGDQRLDAQEARMLNRLRHENIVRFHEFWEEQGSVFMALELLGGQSLAARLQASDGRLDVHDAVEVVRQAARGLSAAHAQGLIHRGVTPDNLQIVPGAGDAFTVKVLDFRVAKQADAATVLGRLQVVHGLEYASPEQCGFALARGEALDARADVYSLGVVLYQMLTGELPVRAGTLMGYRDMHLHVAVAPPSSHLLPGALPTDLEKLVMSMLAKRRAERPATMEALIAALPAPPAVKAAQPAAGSAPARQGKRGELADGTLFAQRYKIEGRLGAGGMGVVYRAIDTMVDEPVALKVIAPHVIDDRDGLDRLKREVVLARRIAHPNACRTYDIGEHEGTAYVTMELIEGESLGKLVETTTPRMETAEVLRVARDVLKALVMAHGVGVVHRDLKPDNIMVAKDGHMAIMDFGLSVSRDTRRVTRVGTVVGTPAYMPPEQIIGKDVDRRSDLYSLGVILFQLATGRLPFVGDNHVAVMTAHVREAVPRASEVWPGVPPELDLMILKAMAKNRDERYQSAQEFLDAVEAQIAGARAAAGAGAATAALVPERPISRGFVERALDGAARAFGRLRGGTRNRAKDLVEQAQARLASGDRAGAIALLEQTGTEHPLVTQALAALRSED